MKNLKYIYLLVFVILSCTRFEDPTIGLSNKVELTTSKVTVISSDTALFEGNILKDGNEGISARGFAYHTAAKPKITNKTVKTGLGIGIFSGRATDLLPNTQYFVAAFAINKSGSVYGADLSFNTPKSAPILPQTCTSVTNLQTTSARVFADVKYDGGILSASGFLYSTSSSTSTLVVTNTSTARISTSISSNNMSANLTGLTAGTLYYFRAFITSPSGTGYGPVCSFTTTIPIIPILSQTCNSANNLQNTSALVSANVINDGGSVTSSGFLYTTNPFADNIVVTNPNTPRVSASIINNSMSVNLTGLTDGKTYYYRAYISGPDGAGYGPICAFATTTTGIVIPTVVTNSATEIYSGCQLNGTIISDGGGTIISKGFQYAFNNPSFIQPFNQLVSSIGSTFDLNITMSYRPLIIYYRAFARNSVGTGYGEIKQFTFR